MSLEFLNQHGICCLVQIAECILRLHDGYTQLRMSFSQRTRVGENRAKHLLQQIRAVKQLMRELAPLPPTVLRAETTNATMPAVTLRPVGFSHVAWLCAATSRRVFA